MILKSSCEICTTSRVAVSLDREGKASKKRRKDGRRNEGEEEKKNQEYINRRNNTKLPNQNRTPHTTSDTSASSSLVQVASC